MDNPLRLKFLLPKNNFQKQEIYIILYRWDLNTILIHLCKRLKRGIAASLEEIKDVH